MGLSAVARVLVTLAVLVGLGGVPTAEAAGVVVNTSLPTVAGVPAGGK